MNLVQHGLENQIREKLLKAFIDTGPQPLSMVFEYLEMDAAMNMKNEEISTSSI